MNMASLDDTYFDFTDMGVDVFQNDSPISEFPPSPADSPLDLFESPDTKFFNEDEKAVMGLISYQQSCGSLSPSANSHTSDDMPTTPLSGFAETASCYLQGGLETGQTVLISYSQLLDQFEHESEGLSGGQPTTQGGQTTRDDAGLMKSTGINPTRQSTEGAAPPAEAGREQTLAKMTINAVGVKSSPRKSSRSIIGTARGSSNVRQDKNNLHVAKSPVNNVGVKRKTVQVEKEEAAAKRVKISYEDSTMSRNQKNAIAARENRLKKKMELEELKRNESLLQEENQCLREENSDHLETIRGLKEEVEYYKSVLFNQSSLAAVLQSLNPKPKLKLSSSLGVSSEEQVVGAQSMSGGVCLHVNGTDASLEWCSKCSVKAQASFNS